ADIFSIHSGGDQRIGLSGRRQRSKDIRTYRAAVIESFAVYDRSVLCGFVLECLVFRLALFEGYEQVSAADGFKANYYSVRAADAGSSGWRNFGSRDGGH